MPDDFVVAEAADRHTFFEAGWRSPKRACCRAASRPVPTGGTSSSTPKRALNAVRSSSVSCCPRTTITRGRSQAWRSACETLCRSDYAQIDAARRYRAPKASGVRLDLDQAVAISVAGRIVTVIVRLRYDDSTDTGEIHESTGKATTRTAATRCTSSCATC